MPDEDKSFGGSLVLDFRKWWRHMQAKNKWAVMYACTKLHGGHVFAFSFLRVCKAAASSSTTTQSKSWARNLIVEYSIFYQRLTQKEK